MFIESQVVNPTYDSNLPTDPDTMVRYLDDIVDLWGNHPAYLRVDGRPVILVYYASRPNLTEAQWKYILTTVRASGRNPIVIGDFYHSRLINVLDGEYQYINVTLSSADLLTQDTVETLRVRTFNMLAPLDHRRIWVASVCPGMYDRRIRGRTAPCDLHRSPDCIILSYVGRQTQRMPFTLAFPIVGHPEWNASFLGTDSNSCTR